MSSFFDNFVNKISSSFTPTTHGEENEKKLQEIFYNGYFYDVTDFISKHPGGSVIKFYTERGEDATQAIDQFHFRSKNRVNNFLKTLKKRPAEDHERGLEPKALTRHKALSADFKKLYEDLVAEGYFKPSYPHVILRLVEAVSLLIVAHGVFLQCETFANRFFGAIFVGFAMSRYGWLLHEGGHNSLTGNPKWDKLIENFGACFVLGGSSAWWNSQHNRHHAMPQRVNHDVDLATLPFVAFHPKTVTSPNQISNFFVRFQGVFYCTLDMFVITIAWRIVLHPRYQLHKKAYGELLLGLPSLFLGFYHGLAWFAIMGYWFAFFLGVNFALSHSHLEVTEEPTHWVEYSLTHTANVSPTPLVDFIMGYLNYQIEHHLFPSMPQFRHKQIMPRVKALAEKHGLPYQVYSYPEACRLAFGNLHRVGQALTSKGHFKNVQNVQKEQ